MLGFGSIAADLGEPLWRCLILTFGLWSMTGQLAFIELTASDIAGWTVVLAVTVANIRLLPLTLATIPLVRIEPGLQARHFWIAQINSVTSYVQLTHAANAIADRTRRERYFHGVCVAALALGLTGTILGHTAASTLPPEVLRTLVFTTPLYMLLLSGRTPDHAMFGAALLGCVLVPLAQAWSPQFGVIAGGLVAGTIAFAIGEMMRNRTSSGPQP
jgi:predicted branched-subunit amino acid permease